ncbi:MAG: hypothetical protein ACJ789_14450 [Thermomicrobiales bacterium]|jgi:hypothetical protein
MDNVSGRPLAEPAFEWKDHSRFVNIYLVERGWLVVWGKYEDLGTRKLVYGHQIYRDLDGVKRRVTTAIIELTANPSLVHDALALLARQGLPPHRPQDLPATL